MSENVLYLYVKESMKHAPLWISPVELKYWSHQTNDSLLRLGNANVTELLLQRGANIDAEDADKDTPLHMAARNGKLHLI